MLKPDYTPISTFTYNQIYNEGFNFLLLDENLKALHTPFMCKDYIQDILWCEYNKKHSHIYGLDWEPGRFDISKEYFYLALMGGTVNMQERIPHLREFLNRFEDALGIPPTEIEETDVPENIVLKFHRDWTVNGPMMSSYTTLIRVSGAYISGQDPIEYIKEVIQEQKELMSGKTRDERFPKYMSPEMQRLYGLADYRTGGLKQSDLINKIAALLQGKRPESSWEDFSTIQMAHGIGIIGFKEFPQVDV